jgi:acyl-CoA synthetase (AMP-forming)/AMP-acid ligase II
VYPAEVEAVIMQMAGVTGVCVYGIPDAKWGEAIKAVVEVQSADKHTAKQVSDFVASKIAGFKKPQVVAFTNVLPRTGDDTVDREAVKARWGDGR